MSACLGSVEFELSGKDEMRNGGELSSSLSESAGMRGGGPSSSSSLLGSGVDSCFMVVDSRLIRSCNSAAARASNRL